MAAIERGNNEICELLLQKCQFDVNEKLEGSINGVKYVKIFFLWYFYNYKLIRQFYTWQLNVRILILLNI